MTRRVNWVGSRKVRGKATATNGTSDHPRRTDSLAAALLGCACRRHTARRFLLASLIGARLIVSKIGQPNNEHSQPFLMLVQLLLCRFGCCFRALDIRSTPGFRTLVTPRA